MGRMIDADALYKSFGATGNCNDCLLDAYKCQYYNEHTLMEFCERIDDAPTVDAVEVVRCKDCKYFYWWVSQGKEEFDCHQFLEVPPITPDWYCAWGERREDA